MKKGLILMTLLLVCTMVGTMGWAEETSPPPKDIKASLSIFNWGNLQEAEVYEKAIKRFQERYPNVSVQNNMTPVVNWSDYVDKWVTLIAGGNAPDIINIAIEGAQLAVDKKLLMPLNTNIETDAAAKEHLSEIPKPLIDAFTVDNSVYLIPNGWQTIVVYYNTKMFKEKGMASPKPDWTWDDFLNIAQQLTSGSGNDKIYGFGLGWGFFHWHPFFITNDTYPITPDFKHSNLSDPKFIEAVAFLNDLTNKYGVSPDPRGLNVYDQFAASKIAMVGAGRWPLNSWRDSKFKDFDCVPFPRKRKEGTVFGCAGWGISPQSKHNALAWELIKELVNTQTMKEIMLLGQQITPLKTLSQDPAFLEAPPENAKLLWSVVHTAKPVASPPYFMDLERITRRYMEEVFSGAMTPEEAMNNAHEELENAIK